MVAGRKRTLPGQIERDPTATARGAEPGHGIGGRNHPAAQRRGARRGGGVEGRHDHVTGEAGDQPFG